MFSNDVAIAKFKAIIGEKEGWQYLKDSQFVNHLSVFVSWALRASQYGSERALQEQFLSTALNQYSILSHAEDRGYIPRKALPSTGSVTIKNNGTASVALPTGLSFQSNYAIDYRIEIPTTILHGETATVDISQILQVSVLHEVTEAKPYYEIIFDGTISGKISRIDVSVDQQDGAGYKKWELARLLRNTMPDSTVYDEFYTHTGQMGIRFGNGDFGCIVQLGASVLCDLWLTEGATLLQAGIQLTLSYTSDLLDIDGQIASITVTVSDTISGGSPLEAGDELRKNLFYWPLYQEQLVWKEDYEFFLRHTFPEILWINVWGEKEAETAINRKRLDFINRIFVSAYAEDDELIGLDIMNELQNFPLLNRRFKWVEPKVTYFRVLITGAVDSKYDPVAVNAQITESLEVNYGLNSRLRKPVALLKDIYALVEATGSFAEVGDYTVTLAGDTGYETPELNEIIAIDIGASAISLTRLHESSETSLTDWIDI